MSNELPHPPMATYVGCKEEDEAPNGAPIGFEAEEDCQALYYEYLLEQNFSEAEHKARVKWEQAREGRRTIRAKDMFLLPRTRPQPFLENLIYPGSLLILAGSPKAGKSTFLRHALQAITTGKEFCGLKTRLATVLYASEQPDPSLFTQIEKVPGYDKNENIFFLPLDFNFTPRSNTETSGREVIINYFPTTWEQQVMLWKEELEKTNANILVIDTFTAFGLFKVGEAFDSGPVTTRFQQLKTLQTSFPGLSIVVLHHLRKEDMKKKGDPTFHDIANSYALTAASDMNAILWQPSKKKEDSNLRSIKIQGRFLDEELPFSFRKNGQEFSGSDASTKKNWNEIILERVLAHPDWWDLSIRELADKLEVKKHYVESFRMTYPKEHPVFQVSFKRDSGARNEGVV
jgi:AAA domain